MDPPKCVLCKCEICNRCGIFLHCRTCWNKLNPQQKKDAEKYFKKSFVKEFSFMMILFSIIFIAFSLPIIFLRNNEPLFILSIIGLVFTMIFSLLFLADRKAKKDGKPGLFKELKKNIRNRPKIDNKSKKVLIITLLVLLTFIVIVIIIAAVIMADFNARWS